MTITEIRNNLPKMVIWMAKEAVMKGVRACREARNELNKQGELQDAGKPYNCRLGHAKYEAVSVAASVLWKLFQSCEADCQSAIEKVAEKKNGYLGNPEKYFDEFILALEERVGTVYIRKQE